MNSRPTLALATSLGALAAALAAFAAPPRPAATAAPPMDPAHLAQLKSLYSEKCSACHNLPDPVGESKTRPEWQRTVNTMLTRYNASQSISPDEAAQIVDYLATFAPNQNAPNGRPGGDPWATDSTDVWTVMPTVSRVFNFVGGDSLSQFGVIGAGAAGPPPTWRLVTESPSPDGVAAQVRLAKPSPNRFGLLMDRQDQAQNLDIQVRFHIVAGKVTPAVGIVFGFTGPKSYSVLAYNQARNDLSLIQIAEPTHTTLQQTPISLPTNGVQTAATQTAAPPASGWHTLRLLVNDGQVRGWLDHTKRVSIADPTYLGGKVGLWAQGDTVAAFQDWTVDIYDSASPPTGQPQ